MPNRIAGADDRRRELAKIHIAAEELGLDRAAYEDMLWTLERVRSSADLDQAGRRRVLDHLRKRGFSDVSKVIAPPAGRKPAVAPDRQALIDEIERRLAARGRPWNYARAMAERMFKLQLEWCQPDHLRRLVAALEYDRRRREVKP
jgi:phage gp16-like protein